jgi:ParB family transcriptional regulator, chromosome partitioning protein
MTIKKRGLGRGLDALLTPINRPAPAATTDSTMSAADPAAPAVAVDGDLRNLPVDLIQRGKYQPRKDMQQEALEELAASIRVQGVMQPIVVRPVGDKRYEIIAGERRWRASQLAGLDTIPAVIRDVPDEAAIAMSLIENIQRENLNPIEEAVALSRLQAEFNLTQQEVADAVGKSRTTVTNLLRLMALKDDVRRLLEHGDIEMGHARALLGLPESQQSRAASMVVAKALSVRQTEALVRKLQAEANPDVPATREASTDIKRLQDDIAEKIGAPVAIQCNAKGKGTLVIRYNSLDELDGILAHIR